MPTRRVVATLTIALAAMVAPTAVSTADVGSASEQSARGAAKPTALNTADVGSASEQSARGAAKPTALNTADVGSASEQSARGAAKPTALSTASEQSARGAAKPTAISTAPFVDRAFTVRAEAYPMEPAPGTQDTEVAIRPSATRASATNPPSAAFARAAAADLGLAEAYFGQQGPSVAADTETRNEPEDAELNEGGTHLEAHVRDTPRASAIAIGSGDASSGGSFSSRSEAIGDGDVLVATASSEANDVAIGPFVLGSGRFDAEARIDGTPDGARGSGTITTSDASFGGVPIVIDDDGFAVDESRVPAPLLDQATASLQEAFAPGGFADIRVVQPEVEVADDGSSVVVSGGGLHVFFTNNDPAERYFVGFVLLGGETEASLGGVLSVPTRTVTITTSPPRSAAPPAVTPSAPTVGAALPQPDAPAPAPEAPVADVTEIAYDGGRQVLGLRGIWSGLVWLVVGVGALWVMLGLLQTPWLAGPRRTIVHRLDALADRFTRG